MKEIDQLKKQSLEELKKTLNQLREELLKYNFEKEAGTLKKYHHIKKTKKKIARILTLLRHEQLQAKTANSKSNNN